ncbi:hypothetical protein BGZ49_003732, partial [Haplosporangium sp. Z 27]
GTVKMDDKNQRINRIKSKEPGISYFLSLPTATKLSAKDFVLDYHNLFPDARDKWIVDDWHYWKTFYSNDPEWTLAFTNEQLSIQDTRRWRNELNVNTRVTRSSNKGRDLEKDTPTNDSGFEQELSLAPAILDNIPTSSSAPPASSISSSSSGSASSTSRSSTLSHNAIVYLRPFFKENFYHYLGPRWLTDSGTDVDEAMFSYIMDMVRESLLHSFIIAGDVDLPPSLSVEDQTFIREYIQTSDNNHIEIALEEWMQNELSQYLLSPSDLVYNKNQYKLPQQASESWYLRELWGFIPEVLCEGEFHHGEKTSTASSTRKNLDRNLSTRFKQGIKADGM